MRKKVFAMLADNRHNGGHIAVWTLRAPGLQAILVPASPETYSKPPYVGVRGWVGIEFANIGDEHLASPLCEAWRWSG